jgi:hypothetical protein
LASAKQYREANKATLAKQCREYRRRNLDYKKQADREAYQRRQDVPRPRHREPWTPQEDAIVKRGDLYSHKQMCYMLGRSYSAILGRRALLRGKGIKIECTMLALTPLTPGSTMRPWAIGRFCEWRVPAE